MIRRLATALRRLADVIDPVCATPAPAADETDENPLEVARRFCEQIDRQSELNRLSEHLRRALRKYSPRETTPQA